MNEADPKGSVSCILYGDDEGAAHEAAAGHALSEPSDNYTAGFSNGSSTTIIML